MSTLYPPKPGATTAKQETVTPQSSSSGKTEQGNAATLRALYGLTNAVDSTQKWLDLIMDVFEKTKNRDIEKDKKAFDQKIDEGLQQRHLGILLMLSGKDDGKVYMAANEAINSARQMKGMLESNPEGYKVHSAYKLVFGENAGQGAISQMMTLMQYGAGNNVTSKSKAYGNNGTSLPEQDVWSDRIAYKDRLYRGQLNSVQTHEANKYVDEKVKSTMTTSEYHTLVHQGLKIGLAK